MNKTTISFTLPSAIALNLVASVQAVDNLPGPATGAGRFVKINTVTVGAVKTISVIIGYTDAKTSDVVFEYKYGIVIENGVVTNDRGTYTGTKNDFRCGDIGLFSMAVITDDAEPVLAIPETDKSIFYARMKEHRTANPI